MAALIAACLGLCGFQTQQMPRGLIPDHADAPVWRVLKAGTTFTIDPAKGLYLASFGPSMRAADGKSFSVAGYILPLEAQESFRHFVVMRRSPGCPFCPPSEIGEAVEVFAKTAIRYTASEVKVTGRLRLIASSSEGLFYRLDEAAVS